MSFTRTVPAGVPSVFHNSYPRLFSAAKNTTPSTSVNQQGSLEFGPGAMSFRDTVPAAVPSVFQTSYPIAGSRPVK
jgi:hypothetical protein